MTDSSILPEPPPADPPRPGNQRVHCVLLALILLFAAVVRLHRLRSESMWYDECATVSVIRAPWNSLVRSVIGTENTPPLHYFLVKAWSEIAGFGEWSMRFPSAMLGVLSVFLIYRLCAYCIGRPEGLIAAALMAASRYHLFYSQEARAYTLMLALALWSCDEFVRLLDQPPSWKRDLRYWLATVLLLYSHIYAIFAVIAQVVHFLVRLSLRRTTPLTLGRFSQLQLAVWILFAPWAPVLMGQYRHRAGGFWIGPASIDDVTNSYWLYLADGNRALMLASIALLVLGTARKDVRSFLPLLLSLLLIPVVAPVIFSMLTHPLFHPRYGLIAMVGLFILIACGIGRLRTPLQAPIVVLFGALMLIAPNPQPKPRFRDAGAYLARWMQSGDYIEVNDIPIIEPIKYYLTRDDVKKRSFRGIRLPLGVPLTDPRSHVWLLMYQSTPAQNGVLTIQAGNWRVASQKSFGDFAILELADGATEAREAYPDEIRFNARPVTKNRIVPTTAPGAL